MAGCPKLTGQRLALGMGGSLLVHSLFVIPTPTLLNLTRFLTITPTDNTSFAHCLVPSPLPFFSLLKLILVFFFFFQLCKCRGRSGKETVIVIVVVVVVVVVVEVLVVVVVVMVVVVAREGML